MSERESPAARLEAWYSALGAREQLIVRAGSLVAAALLVAGVVLQLHAAVQRAERRVAAKRADVAFIAGVLPELRAAPLPQSAGQSLVTVIDRTTRDAGLGGSLRGTEPSGISGVRVRLEGASFETLVTWLLRVEREYGLAIPAATLEKTDAPGRVNASLTFVPG
jgi:general secretion pathway protein M